jgi:hypothetical protein
MCQGRVRKVPELYPPGLDPTHILAVCAHVTGGRHGLALSTGNGMYVCLPSRRAARTAAVALTRVGYQAQTVTAGKSREVLVTGWSPAGLEARLAAQRAVVHQLAERPTWMAREAVIAFRCLPIAEQSPRGALKVLGLAEAGLRRWAATRAGVHAPHQPGIRPADPGVALRLRATRMNEQLTDDLLHRQTRVAGHALARFAHLARRIPEDTAEYTALRWASINFHLPTSTAQDTTPLLHRSPSRPGPPPPSASGDPMPTTAVMPVVREFPTGVRAVPRQAPGTASRPVVRQLPTYRHHRHQ